MTSSRLVTSIVIGSLLAVVPAWATGPQISYVPNSLKQSKIFGGPWTLHEAGPFQHHDASGIIPTSPGPPYSGSGTPYAGYCVGGEPTQNLGLSLMQPYYFPFVRSYGPILVGWFDYRPRNEQESTVAAISFDWGVSWIFRGEALGLNPYCPFYDTDPDNQNVSVNGVKTPYGSNPANAADNGPVIRL